MVSRTRAKPGIQMMREPGVGGVQDDEDCGGDDDSYTQQNKVVMQAWNHAIEYPIKSQGTYRQNACI